MKRYRKLTYIDSVAALDAHRAAHEESSLFSPVNLTALAKVQFTDLLYRRLPLIAFKKYHDLVCWVEEYLLYDSNIVTLRGVHVEFNLEGRYLQFINSPDVYTFKYYYYYPEFKPKKEIYPVKNFNMLPSLYNECKALVSTAGTKKQHFAVRDQVEAELWLEHRYPDLGKDNVLIPNLNEQLIPAYRMVD